MLKLEIGKQYKTRGGWRAVVVAMPEFGGVLVWHSIKPLAVIQHMDFCVFLNRIDDSDIVAEWSEPRSGEVWVNLFEVDNGILAASYEQKWEADTQLKTMPKKFKPIAQKHIKWTEGEGL